MESVIIEQKTGWAKFSKTQKTLIIVSGIVIVGGIVYFGFIRKKDEDTSTGGDTKKGDGKSKSESSSTSTDDTTKESTTEVEKETKTTTPTSTNVTKTTTVSTTVHDVKSLPNSGKDCGEVHTNFDRDFDYVKCAGAWWTKSKPNPATASKKGAVPNWKNLASNKIASERLNARYSKG